MAAVVFVETLGRHGQVTSRVRLDGFPAQIGRGYANQVIIDDPFLDAVHARLECDEAGRLTLFRLGSVSGASASAPERFAIDPRRGLELTLGHTRLRLRTAEFEPEPTRIDPFARIGVDRWLDSPRRLLLTLNTSLLGVLAASYLASRESYLGSLDDVVGGVTALLIWSGLWALGTRVVHHRGRWLGHMAAAAAAWLTVVVATAALEYARFLWSDSGLLSALGRGIPTVLMAAAVCLHMLVAGTRNPRRLLMPMLVAGLLGLGFALAEKASEGSKYSGRMDTQISLKPLPAALIPGTDAEQFFEHSRALQQRIDEQLRRD
jgi:hypothetical protein